MATGISNLLESSQIDTISKVQGTMLRQFHEVDNYY